VGNLFGKNEKRDRQRENEIDRKQRERRRGKKEE
jgi:hypothetical protein